MEDEVVEPEAFEQDGPDLFGDEQPPRPLMPPDEATPDDDLPSDLRDPGPLDGPETPAEPDGLETEEDEMDADVIAGSQEFITEGPGTVPDDMPEPPLALYRRYRPETFDQVIGEDHVIEPLKRAILNNRVNHAYLFSGPRGCGKTTTARILARALNCEQGPTPTPCGKCQSCRDLACGGPGSIDVIEIDAASHGGVDDARDLRERAFFAPVHSRYKIYIIDEAHMVTPQGFNALLKLVEEPPPHVKFIFATTEPEKVIGTIRSRTHHYPFRLVPPKILVDYLGGLCAKEGIDVDHAVLPLVVRAGGGSVRDSLSVLDQLLGGAADGHVSYEQAAALLGYTPEALLDEIVDAFAAGDAHEVFATIDKVIEVGQDPRRFAEDLLRRMRDLVIISAVPDACRTGLIDVSPEQATRLAHQVAGFGAGELTRAAEVLATGLTNMRGTTAPRLHLELMCSRILLPAADTDGRGIHARLERLERRLGVSGPVDEGDRNTTQSRSGPRPAERPQRPPQHWPGGGSAAADHAQQPADHLPERNETQNVPGDRRSGPAQTAQPETRVGTSGPSAESRGPQQPARRPSGRPRPSRRDYRPGNQSAGQPSPVPNHPGEQGSHAEGVIDITTLRREWPQVLDAVKDGGRVAWMILSGYAQVLEVHGNQATLGFSNPGAREGFVNGNYPKILHDAVVKVLGVDMAFTAVIGEPPAAVRPEFHQEPTAPEPPADHSWASSPPDSWVSDPGRSDRQPDPTPPGRASQDRPGDRQPGSDDVSVEFANTSSNSSRPTDPSENASVSGSTVENQPGEVHDKVGESGLVAGGQGSNSAEGPVSAEDPSSADSGGAKDSGSVEGPSSAESPNTAEAADPPPDMVPTDPTEKAGSSESQEPDQGQRDSGVPPQTGSSSHAITHRWSERVKSSVRPLETGRHRLVPVEEPPDEEGEWDDTILEESNESPVDLIMRELGGIVIDTSGDTAGT
ncbi:DNA polymerase III subunit gamma and tau [Cutibacterium sp.]|uniref:DNA polymerase III subunit gamma and tau n=1 Tax=Cutibacterium sp. TaxID=1912221 RepID=UPI0026DBFC17|nr:DNA polymerase III subunit gamma and tau [Cutibacterium sp.]MDO4412703.1 DNA polymerase III subunit gamma and tau [Cutibacterium sp.]